MRKAIIDLIRDGEHLAMPERTLTKLTAPTLKAIGTTLYRAPWPHGSTGGSPYILHLQEGAHSFSPISLAPIALRRLEAKQKLAPRYGVKPLWLTLSVNVLRGVWGASMQRLANGCPPIAPFDRVIVCEPGRAIIWSNGIVAVRDLRPERPTVASW